MGRGTLNKLLRIASQQVITFVLSDFKHIDMHLRFRHRPRKNHALTDSALHPNYSQNIRDNIDIFIFIENSCGQGDEL